jgi:transcriptional regulator with XRE-family HTH domain
MIAIPAADIATVRRLLRTGEARQIRLAAGLSLRDLARDPRLAGVAPSTLARWEASDRVPRAGAKALAYGAVLSTLLEIMGDR